MYIMNRNIIDTYEDMEMALMMPTKQGKAINRYQCTSSLQFHCLKSH